MSVALTSTALHRTAAAASSSTETSGIDRVLYEIVDAADETLSHTVADDLRGAILTDRRAWQALSVRRPLREPLAIRAAEGTQLRELLRVLLAVVRTGSPADVSLSWPLSDRLHRTLQRAGAEVRVETLQTWGCRVAHGGHRLRVVGPRLSRSTVLRRARVNADAWTAGADTADVDLAGPGEIERLALAAASFRSSSDRIGAVLSRQ
ncbi:hypothetical protein [Microbacterium sp. NPDC057650]|uniref:hypothetical protein n=1 Tax=unclassified Microbacterium TaxID=2609290 RepID=UPI00367253C1